jgi:hypothetical protein
MADLAEVQVRTLVDETDIGKIQAGMRATITVDAYPNRPFEATVLKIEPQSSVSQNVTMFPVLIRIPNEQGFLRPGMNASVEIHVANRSNVLAIPNSALRTQRDVESAAQVLGIDLRDVEATLARQDSLDRQNPQTARGQQGGGQAGDRATPGRAASAIAAVPPQASGGMRTSDAQSPARRDMATGSSARQAAAVPAAGPPDAGAPPGAGMQAGGAGARMNVPLPEGVTEEMRAEIRRKRQAGEALTPAESTASVRMREAFQRLREQQGGAMPGAQGAAAAGAPAGQGGGAGEASALRLQPAGSGEAQRRRFGSGSSFQFGGSYIVFVLQNGQPTPKRIRTGYTDMDYSEVVSGLTERDTVLLLPSASLVNQQTQMRNRMSQMGGGVPGMTKAPTGGPGGGGPPPGGGRPGGDH